MKASLTRPGLLTTLLVLLVSLLIAGCDSRTTTPASTGDPGPLATATPGERPSPTPANGYPAPDPTGTTGTAVAPIALLPAPLYFVNQDGQIMRLEQDGETLFRLTNEPEPITDFDVSPVDNSLVYVSGNQLIAADSTGGNRFVKVAGEPFAEDDIGARFAQQITRPRFSPDGTQFMFGLNGVNVMPVGPVTDYTVVQASDPHPDLPGVDFDPTGDPIRFFQPMGWSPSGGRLLIEFSYYPEAGGLAIKQLGAEGLATVTSPAGIACCDPTWSQDGTAIYFSSPYDGLITPGLWRADAATGTGVAVIPGYPDTPGGATNYVSHAAELADGRLYAFHTASADPIFGEPLLTLSRLDGQSFIPLRDDQQMVRDALWAADASGAVVVEVTDPQLFSESGPLLWVPASAETAVALRADGREPRWGTIEIASPPTGYPPPAGDPGGEPPAAATAAPTLSSTPVTVPVCSNSASFVADVSVPDGTIIGAGERFTKTWQMRNTGTCSWGAGYRWVFTQGESIGGTAVSLPQIVAPGEDVSISVELTAPSAAGSYQGFWRLQAPDGTNFGTEVYVLITVQ